MQSDAEFIAGSCSDPQQFATIFDRHFDVIYRYIASRLGPDCADDLASEVFSIAFRRRSAYDDTHPDSRPWLFGIATKLIGRHHRTEGRRLRALSRNEIGRSDFDAASIITRVDADAEKSRIAAALNKLSSGDRDVILLYAGEDQSYQEIADALSIPIGTVRSRLNRARRIMRELLAGSGQYQGEGTGEVAALEEVSSG